MSRGLRDLRGKFAHVAILKSKDKVYIKMSLREKSAKKVGDEVLKWRVN